MTLKLKTIIILSMLVVGPSIASDLNPYIKLNDAAKAWSVERGNPLYYTSDKSLYSVGSQSVRRMALYDERGVISLSPHADFRLISLIQDLSEVKNGQRYSDYFILDDQDELSYKVSRGTPSDLKPLVAAISDHGVLALADPVNAKIYFYSEGELLSEGQLYEDEGSVSMERNIHLQWVGNECFILLERPGFNGQPGADVLFIRIDAAGLNQFTAILPFTYLQKYIFGSNRFFISGYNYSSENQTMDPLIIEVNRDGTVLWTHEKFGHELALSENGKYLAALNTHESITTFDLYSKRVKQVDYSHNDLVSLGLAVNNVGDIAVIRVPADFFVKRNTYFAHIYFPQIEQSSTIQIDPRFPKLFQLYSNGEQFYIGTNYEWLEIRP